MGILLITLVSLYLIKTCHFVINWLKFFSPCHLSVEDRLLSMIILFIATILWPFVIPISCLAFLNKINLINFGSRFNNERIGFQNSNKPTKPIIILYETSLSEWIPVEKCIHPPTEYSNNQLLSQLATREYLTNRIRSYTNQVRLRGLIRVNYPRFRWRYTWSFCTHRGMP